MNVEQGAMVPTEGDRDVEKQSALPGVKEDHDLEEQSALSQGKEKDVAVEDVTQTNSQDEKQANGFDGESTGKSDPHLVDWDGPDDPENPMNWSSRKKAGQIASLSLLTFTTPLASSMFAPGVPQVLAEFNSDNILLASFVVSVYLIGYAAGPLVFAPMSEVYGRLINYQISTVLFVAFTIGCAFAPSLNSLIGLRFLAGAAGSAPLVLGGGTIADVYPREQRGAAMSIFSMGPLMGPVIGPVAGAFLTETEGWRWVFRLIAILGGVVCVLVFLVQRETWAPVILERKARQLQKETGDMAYRSKLSTSNSPKQELVRACKRPTKLLFTSPTIAIFCIYISLVYGYLYLIFTTVTEVYEDEYGWSTGIAALSFIGLGLGMIIGMIVFGATSDRRIKSIQARGTEAPPEVRLEALIPAAIVFPIGFFWYGWSADKHIHWIMPIIGLVWIGLGTIGMFMGVQTYLVDCYPKYAASVTSSNTVLRSLIGALLPLAGQPLYQNLGLGWGNSLLGFIAIAMAPLPFVFMKYGRQIRTNPRFKVEF